eukprot:gene17054-biopygen12780
MTRSERIWREIGAPGKLIWGSTRPHCRVCAHAMGGVLAAIDRRIALPSDDDAERSRKRFAVRFSGAGCVLLWLSWTRNLRLLARAGRTSSLLGGGWGLLRNSLLGSDSLYKETESSNPHPALSHLIFLPVVSELAAGHCARSCQLRSRQL